MDFTIRFISPTLVGGAYPRDFNRALDWRSLGKPLRGGWRFWARALLAGRLADPPDARLIFTRESSLFGSASEDPGATFRLQIKPLSTAQSTYARLPHRDPPANPRDRDERATRRGLSPEAEFGVSLRPRPRRGGGTALTSEQHDALLAAIWLWAYLGSLGNRARRGFGSPVLAAAPNGTEPFTGAGLPLKQEFEGPEDLAETLKAGVARAWELFGDWLNGLNPALLQPDGTLTAAPAAASFSFFTLRSLQQIAVSALPTVPVLECELPNNVSRMGVIYTVHGDSSAYPDLGYARKKSRLASPAYIRLHRVGVGWLPVCTYGTAVQSPLALNPAARRFLTQTCGFANSLLGVPW